MTFLFFIWKVTPSHAVTDTTKTQFQMANTFKYVYVYVFTQAKNSGRLLL